MHKILIIYKTPKLCGTSLSHRRVNMNVLVRRKRPLNIQSDRIAKRQCIEVLDNNGLAPGYRGSGGFNVAPSFPSISPHDKESFLRRVHTYSPHKWDNVPKRKPGPFYCALYGWECVSRNLLKCTCCQEKLSFHGNRNNRDILAIQVKRFREKIEATGHLEGCHWIANPSPESFCHLPSSTSEMECVFTENLKTFNVALNHTFNLPCLTKECRDSLLKEIHPNIQQQVTDAMLLAACGWRLRETPYQYNCLQCKYCNCSLPVGRYSTKKHSTIIPDTTRSLSYSSMIQQAPIVSPLSIDQPPPSFGTNNTSFGGGLGFWEDGKSDYSRKRKLSDEYFNTDSENKPSKKSKMNSYENSLVLTSTINKVNRRKRMRESSDFETDLEERENKKKKMEIDEPETQVLAPRGRKRRNTTENILLTKRRRTNDGGIGGHISALDAINEHHPCCPFLTHFYYSTGNGEVPGYIHSIRCMPLDPEHLKYIISHNVNSSSSPSSSSDENLN